MLVMKYFPLLLPECLKSNYLRRFINLTWAQVGTDGPYNQQAIFLRKGKMQSVNLTSIVAKNIPTIMAACHGACF
jgi:hypothetical protein